MRWTLSLSYRHWLEKYSLRILLIHWQVIIGLSLSANLDALVGVAHHGNEHVDKDDGGDEHVEAEDDLIEVEGPLGLGRLDAQIFGLRQAEQREEQELERVQRRYHHW